MTSEPALRVIMRRLREIMSEPGDGQARLDKIGRWFWGATRHVLERESKCGTRFEEANYAFSLAHSPWGGYYLSLSLWKRGR